MVTKCTCLFFEHCVIHISGNLLCRVGSVLICRYRMQFEFGDLYLNLVFQESSGRCASHDAFRMRNGRIWMHMDADRFIRMHIAAALSDSTA